MSSPQVALYFEKAEAIDETISDDVLLSILAFVPYSIRGVNKHLTKIDEKRERIEMIKIYEEYKDDDRNKDTVIIHPKRTKLNEIEKEYGFWGIESSIQRASKLASRILIHSGVHVADGINASRGIQIIGIGDVIIKRKFEIPALGIPHLGLAEFVNITFDDVVTLKSGSATFKNCTFTVREWYGMAFGNDILNDDTLTLQSCKFTVMMTEESQKCFRSYGTLDGTSGIHWGMGNGSTKSNNLVVNDCDFRGLDSCVTVGYFFRNLNEAVKILGQYGQFANNRYSKKYICLPDPVNSGHMNYKPCENKHN